MNLETERLRCKSVELNTKKIFGDYSLLKLITLAMGIFVTMPIITIKIFSLNISVFSLFFVLFILAVTMSLLTSKSFNNIGKSAFLYGTWLFISIMSSLFGLLYFNGLQEWKQSISGYIPKIVLYLILLVLISINNKKQDIVYYFFKGFLLGCIFNIIWSVIEGVTYYTLGFSLSNDLFSNYINTLSPERQFSSLINSGGIRVAGFNTDPAHLGGIIPVVILYSAINRKYLLLVLCIGALAFSQSTTALVCSLILLLLNTKKIFRKIKIKTNLKKVFLLSISIFAVITFFFMFKDNQIINSIYQNFNNFFNRVSENYININETSDNLRISYFVYLPLAILYSGIKIITGAGFGISSYPYVLNDRILGSVNGLEVFPYDPENNYISYLFNTGFVGLLLYIYILYKSYMYYNKRYSEKEKSLILASLGSVIFSGFFYHYILTAYQVLIIIMASVLMDSEKEKNIFKNDNLQ